jgi:hypothetical protein
VRSAFRRDIGAALISLFYGKILRSQSHRADPVPHAFRQTINFATAHPNRE